MTEPDAPAGPPDQPGPLGGQPRVVLGVPRPGRDGGGVDGVHRGQEQQGPRGGGGKPVQPGGEDPLQAIGERERTRGRRLRGGVVRAARPRQGGRPRQFGERQRVAGGLVEDPRPGPAGGSLRPQVQQAVGRGVVERPEGQHRYVAVEPRHRAVGAGPEQHRDRLPGQPSGGEGQRVQGGPVAPLRVVHHHQDGLPVAQGREQAQHGRPDHHQVGFRRGRFRAEGVAQRGALPLRQRLHRGRHRPQHLVQRGERETRLRLAPVGAQDTGAVRLGPARRGVQQRALPRAHLADEQEQRVGRGGVHGTEEARQLRVPADDRLLRARLRARDRAGAACALVHGVSRNRDSASGAALSRAAQVTSATGAARRGLRRAPLDAASSAVLRRGPPPPSSASPTARPHRWRRRAGACPPRWWRP